MARRLSRTPLLPSVTADLRGNQEALNRALYQDGIDNANRANLSFPKDGTEDFQAPLPLWPTPSAGLPDAAEWVGSLLYDEDVGAMAWSDGVNWLYVPGSTTPADFPIDVPHGGTGLSTLTPYGLMFGGTTATGAMQQLGLGSLGQILTSQGAGALPAWASVAASGVALQTFTADGTYTPTVGMKYCLVIATAGGGGGGGADCADTSAVSGAGGGGGAETRIGLFDAATIGASQAVTVGEGGAGGAASGGADGADGEDTVFGGTPLLRAERGYGVGNGGGTPSAAFAASGGPQGGYPGSPNPGTGGFAIAGGDGHSACTGASSAIYQLSGHGGSSFWGGGPYGQVAANGGQYPGLEAFTYGTGGGGALSIDNTTGAAGGDGADGVVFILEFL